MGFGNRAFKGMPLSGSSEQKNNEPKQAGSDGEMNVWNVSQELYDNFRNAVRVLGPLTMQDTALKTS